MRLWTRRKIAILVGSRPATSRIHFLQDAGVRQRAQESIQRALVTAGLLRQRFRRGAIVRWS